MTRTRGTATRPASGDHGLLAIRHRPRAVVPADPGEALRIPSSGASESLDGLGIQAHVVVGPDPASERHVLP